MCGPCYQQAMTPRVKICGLTRPEDIQAALGAGATYLGFITEAGGPRNLSRQQAARLALPAKGIAARVAVTVNASNDLIAFIADQMQADYIQFHGDEDIDRIMDIAKRHSIKVIKALPIEDAADLKRAAEFSPCDLVLLDAKPPKGAAMRGGHGLSFDWSLLSGAHLARASLLRSWALAGGLNPDNVSQALAMTKAPILDVSSGVEASAGIKDSRKIKAFMSRARLGA